MSEHRIKVVIPPSVMCVCGSTYEIDPKDTRPWEKALLDWMDMHKAHVNEFAEAELTDDMRGVTGE